MYSKQKTLILLFQAAIAILPLILGALIYLFFRPVEPVFIEWLQLIGFENALNLIHLNLTEPQIIFSNWIIFSLPSGLWAFVYTFLIVSIWSGYNSPLKYYWLASIPILIFGFELLQLPQLVRGTFSISDLVFGMVGIVPGYFIALNINKLNKNGNKS